MAVRNTENKAAGLKTTQTVGSHEGTNWVRPDISCTPDKTGMLKSLWGYVLIVTLSMSRRELEYTRVHRSTLEYIGVHRSTLEYIGVYWSTLEYTGLH